MQSPRAHPVPSSSTSHLDNSTSPDARSLSKLVISPPQSSKMSNSPRSSDESLTWSDRAMSGPPTPATDPQSDTEAIDKLERLPNVDTGPESTKSASPRRRRASTTLISENAAELHELLGGGETGTQLIEKFCCGGGCCFVNAQFKPNAKDAARLPGFTPVELPDNDAFRALKLALGPLALDSELTGVAPLPPCAISLDGVSPEQPKHVSNVATHPPQFVKPHAPYDVFSAPIHHARELTKKGAVKRTFHFDLDVTDYPDEGGVDFKVGGAVGICPPNETELVDEIFNLLGVPSFVRDKPVVLRTQGGRWPTIWGDDEARALTTTRRELLTWCSDVQSSPPTKPLLRLLAEHADAPNERTILTYLCSAQGQAAFCDLRTGPHITVPQLLHAFPSAHPPLPHLLSVLPQIMPRFYSLSNDPHVSSSRPGLAGGRRLIEMAVTVHETPNWRGGPRTGLGSGYLERQAQRFRAAARDGASPPASLHVPLFRGLMANPLSQRFASDGPMMLVGAGVGMAPFRGFILNRLRSATCANKIWLVQGVRDASLDELYQGELGLHEHDIKRVVESRATRPPPLSSSPAVLSPSPAATPAGSAQPPATSPAASAAAPPTPSKHAEARYVQDEVRLQADVVWFVINALDGRVFVCGSSQGMGEGVAEALVDVAMDKAGLNREEAVEFWEAKRQDGQYITETW